MQKQSYLLLCAWNNSWKSFNCHWDLLRIYLELQHWYIDAHIALSLDLVPRTQKLKLNTSKELQLGQKPCREQRVLCLSMLRKDDSCHDHNSTRQVFLVQHSVPLVDKGRRHEWLWFQSPLQIILTHHASSKQILCWSSLYSSSDSIIWEPAMQHTRICWAF